MFGNGGTNSILSGTFWGIVAKIIDAIVKFFTIPLLVLLYGKMDYGLIVLAFSLNAYLKIMDLGMNVGAIRYYSTWLSNNEFKKIIEVSQSGLIFYGIIGILNSLIYVVLANYSDVLFNLRSEQYVIFKEMMYFLSVATIFEWTSNIIVQLLNAHGEQAWLNKVQIIGSLLILGAALISYFLKLSLVDYYIFYLICLICIIPINYYKLKVYGISRKVFLRPKWHWNSFKTVLNYGLAIVLMAIFQMTATNIRPLLLSKYSSNGIGVLTEFKVMQTVAGLIFAFGSVFLQVLLPSTSKSYAENNFKKINFLIYNGTKYISIFLSGIVFYIISSSELILTIYMGDNYSGLSFWLSLWLITVLISLHNTPVSSLVLSTGKTKFLVFSSGYSCVISIIITVVLAYEYNVGAAVVGFLVYTLVQISSYYIYYIPRILKLNGIRIFFKSFMPPVIVGICGCLIVEFLNSFYLFDSKVFELFINFVIFIFFYGSGIIFFVLNKFEFNELKIKFLKFKKV